VAVKEGHPIKEKKNRTYKGEIGVEKHITHAENSDLAPGSSHRSPVPLGTAIKIALPYKAEDRQSYNMEIILLQIVRGKEAWEQVKAQGVSDEPPKAGFEYILALIRFGYFRRARGGPAGDPYKLMEGQFIVVSSDGKTEYEIPHVLRQPEPELIGYTFKVSEVREGWILMQVPKDDKKPLLIFKREHAGTGGPWLWGYVWFQL
jgi:hypothetical protein